ncbi:MAG: cell division protein SepF [Finegoldia sp.]|nr:cell division protein SepF [Finegoldia sp.]
MSGFDSFKKFIGVQDDYEDEYYDDQYYDDDFVVDDVDDMRVDNNYGSKVVNMKSNYESKDYRDDLGKVKINVQEPIKYEDAPGIIDLILKGEVVVVNLEMLEIDTKKVVFNFISGGIYALKGKMQKVAKDIFVLVPEDVEIDGKIKDQINQKEYYQL